MSLIQLSPTQAQVNQDVNEIFQTRYMGFASFTILIWDHIITFPAEVEYIWKGKKSFLVYLFFLNRYLIPLGFIINIVAYNLEYWPDDICEHYVRYEGVMTAFGIEVVGLMMLLRVHAMYYNKSRLVIAFVAFILLAETVTNVYLLVHAGPVLHSKYQTQVHSCSMIYNSPARSVSAWIPLLYDTIVLLLTLYITVPPIRRRTPGYIVRIIFMDGILYYGVIFSVTLVLAIMITSAPQGIQNITAQLELLLTVTMMSRITLHLKKQLHSPRPARHRYVEGAHQLSFSRDRPHSDAVTRSRSHFPSAGGADLGTTFVRPPQVHRLSTIPSARSSILQTPTHSVSTILFSTDMGEMEAAQLRERPEQGE